MTNHKLEPLAFEVVSATSEHSAHPASELLKGEGGGWFSNPLSDEVLQDIVLQLDGPCSIHTIELLAHEFLIPQKVEIIIASNDSDDDEIERRLDHARSFDDCTNVQRLGYVAFSKNAESNYSARELKTVSLGGQKANFVKLRLHSPHPNGLNVHNQVALVGLELIGRSVRTNHGDCGDLVEVSQMNGGLEAEEKEGEREEEEDMEGKDEQQGSSSKDGDSTTTGGPPECDAGSILPNSNMSTSDRSDDEELSSSITSEPNELSGAKIKVPSTIKTTATSLSKEPRPVSDSPPTSLPSPSSSLLKPSVSAREFTERRKRTNDEVQRRLDRLDQIKLQLAAMEDFETAARIKAVVDKTKKSFSKLIDLEARMRRASEKEDYDEASNLKSQRDTTRVEAMHSLDGAESSVAKIIGRNDGLVLAPPDTKVQQVASNEVPIGTRATSSPPPGGNHSSDMWQNTEIYKHSTGTTNLADAERESSDDARACDEPMPPKPSAGTAENDPHLPYSSIQPDTGSRDRRESTQIHSSTNPGDDPALLAATQASFAPASLDDRQGKDCDSLSIGSTATTSDMFPGTCNNTAEEEYNEDNHPLKGVPDYMALPAPEDINNEGEGIATDTITRIETFAGKYLVRCFFSRNYSLREAALAKVSLMLPEMGQLQHDEISTAGKNTAHSSSHYLRTVCIMIERSMNDRVIPVFVASLLLLDDCISEFEQSGMTSKEVISHLSVITPCLISHLGDNKNKVVEGAETALLSMALSKSIGPAYIAHLLTKRTTEMKAARAIIARMRVAQVSIDEL